MLSKGEVVQVSRDSADDAFPLQIGGLREGWEMEASEAL